MHKSTTSFLVIKILHITQELRMLICSEEEHVVMTARLSSA